MAANEGSLQLFRKAVLLLSELRHLNAFVSDTLPLAESLAYESAARISQGVEVMSTCTVYIYILYIYSTVPIKLIIIIIYIHIIIMGRICVIINYTVSLFRVLSQCCRWTHLCCEGQHLHRHSSHNMCIEVPVRLVLFPGCGIKQFSSYEHSINV